MVQAKSECCSFAAHLAIGRWTSVFASFLIMSGAGATYLFANYSNDIKRNLEYNQSALNTLSSWKDIGTSAGILSGLVAEVTPTWFVLAIGSITNFLGYFMVWLAVTGKISKPKVWHMCVYMFIAANSQNFANTGSLVTCVKNFPESRSIMLGLLKGYVGLSGSILTQIHSAIYGDDDSTSLILLIAWLPTLIIVLVMYTIREKEVKIRQPNEVKVFYHFLYISAALAAFLMAMTMIQQNVVFSRAAYAGSAVAVCILLFLPVVIAFRQEVLLNYYLFQKLKPIKKNEYNYLINILTLSFTCELKTFGSNNMLNYSLFQKLIGENVFNNLINTLTGIALEADESTS